MHEVPFGDRDALGRRVLLLALVGGTLLRLLAGATLGLGIDEQYAIAVAREFQWSFLDHRPLGFWMGTLSWSLFESTHPLLIRAPFILLSVVTTLLLYRFTANLFGREAGGWAALLFNLSPLFSPRNAGDVGAILPEAVAHAAANTGPAFQAAVREANSVRSETPSGMRPSEAFALRVERERHRRERATLLAELQQSRAETQVARLEARSEHSRAEAVETMSLEYEKEEDVSVRRLELAAEVRARALEAALKTAREKAAPKAALRAVLAELGELKARLARVRDAQETSARLIAPTVASALACLKL